MEQIVGVKVRKSLKVFTYLTNKLNVARGDLVVVETDRGVTVGTVVFGPNEIESIPQGMRKIIRIVDDEDRSIIEKNKKKEEEAFKVCLECIANRNLEMKLIDVEYMLSGGKAVFYFTANGRVDFRELVKDLARRLNIRIEMRQIGVRDESKMVGGIGPCGLILCCNQHLHSFEPVSIKMAKDQNLIMNPQKVSGLCGRLMCCLTYEQATYEELWMYIPKIGRRLITPEGDGKVVSLDIKGQKISVYINDEIKVYELSVLRELNKDLIEEEKKKQSIENKEIMETLLKEEEKEKEGQ